MLLPCGETFAKRKIGMHAINTLAPTDIRRLTTDRMRDCKLWKRNWISSSVEGACNTTPHANMLRSDHLTGFLDRTTTLVKDNHKHNSRQRSKKSPMRRKSHFQQRHHLGEIVKTTRPTTAILSSLTQMIWRRASISTSSTAIDNRSGVLREMKSATTTLCQKSSPAVS